MKSIIKIELVRALKSKAMLVALAVGIIIALSHIWMYVIPVSDFIDEALSYNKTMYSVPTLFAGWIGQADYTMQCFLFYMIAPILAIMPFGNSFFSDLKSGYIKNVLIKVEKKKYYMAKYIAVFISGGLVIAIPLIINFMITAMFLPAHIPQATSSYSIGAFSMWGNIFYTYPYIYIIGYIIIDFVFYGIIATIALSISLVSEYKFMVSIMPFLIYLFVYSILSSVGLFDYSPFYFLQPGYGRASLSIILIEGVILFAITCITFLVIGVREDIY